MKKWDTLRLLLRGLILSSYLTGILFSSSSYPFSTYLFFGAIAFWGFGVFVANKYLKNPSNTRLLVGSMLWNFAWAFSVFAVSYRPYILVFGVSFLGLLLIRWRVKKSEFKRF